jgi:hypothetical protein
MGANHDGCLCLMDGCRIQNAPLWMKGGTLFRTDPARDGTCLVPIKDVKPMLSLNGSWNLPFHVAYPLSLLDQCKHLLRRVKPLGPPRSQVSELERFSGHQASIGTRDDRPR